MIMRPLDFFNNFNSYVWGLVAYMLLSPFFNTILQVYAFTNLHDVSWGNRPAISDINQASKAATKAENLKKTYEQSRTYWVFMWVMCNVGYMVFIEMFVFKPKETRYCNDFDFLMAFSLFIAFQMSFKIIAGGCYLCNFKRRVKYDPNYTIEKHNMTLDVRKMQNVGRDSEVDKMLTANDYLRDDEDY